MWCKNMGTAFFRFVINYAFDERTERQPYAFLVASPRWHSMQRGKNCGSRPLRYMPLLGQSY